MNTQLTVYNTIRIHVVDATPVEVDRIKVRTGARVADWPAAKPSETSDINIRFVDNMAIDKARTLSSRLAIHGDRCVFLDTGGTPIASMRSPSSEAHSCFDYVVRRGEKQIPLLDEIIQAAAVFRNLLPIHGTAFFHEETGYVVTGCSGGGKTGLMLSFMQQNAAFVAAERPVVKINDGFHEGLQLLGNDQSIRLRAWHLCAMNSPPRLPRKRMGRIRSRVFADRLFGALAATKLRGISNWARSARQRAEKGAYVELQPAELFPDSTIDDAPLQILLLASAQTGGEPRTSQLSPESTLRRLTALTRIDQQELYQWIAYCQYAELDVSWFETFQRHQHHLLEQFATRISAFSVEVSHDLPLVDLFNSLQHSVDKTCSLSH